MRRLLLIGICVLSVSSAAYASGPNTLHARLVPIAPAHSGSGTFRGTVVVRGRSATVKWKLALSGIGKVPARTTLKIGNVGGIALPLCHACKPSSRGTLVMLASAWRDIVAHGGQIVVANKSHPSGLLRGKVAAG
jgi:hypothetical protein